jgi:hypothetical protein
MVKKNLNKLIFLLNLNIIYIILMSGQGFCLAIEDKKERLKKDKKTMNTVNGFATGGLNRLWEKEEDDDNNEVYNFIKNSYNKVKDTVSVNYCSNLIGGTQTNIYKQNPNCFKAIQKICYNDKTKKYDETCLDKVYKIIDVYNDTPIEQTNINSQYAECNINSVLGILTQQEQTLENLAIIKLIQEEQEKNKKSTSDSCSDISADVTKEQYIRSFLECTNNNIINQKNMITSECHPGISSQINVNKSIDRCIVESNIANKSKTQVTQRIVRLNDIDDSVQNQQNNPTNSSNNPTNSSNNPTNPPINNQTNLIMIIVIFIGFIIFMVFLFFIFKR